MKDVVRAAAILAALLLSGCATPATTDQPSGAGDASQRPVVIALLDSGTNPYFPIFQGNVGWLPSAIAVSLTSNGSIADRIEADKATWHGLVQGQLYWFQGTRLLGIGFGNDWNGPPVLDASGHGAGTSYLAARESTDSVIVMVQISGNIDPEQGLSSHVIADAMEWVAAQDWIDVVSISLGVPGNLPVKSEDAADRFLAASHLAATSGKVVVVGGGNHVTPSIASFYAGPPWVISVGGVEMSGQGEADTSSRGVDVVSNYTDLIPSTIEGELDWNSGTSYATPIVAGTLATALERVRSVDGSRSVLTREVRDALNASAAMPFDATDWNPIPPDRNDTIGDLFLWTSLPILTQAQMGWGYVNASLAPEIARRILEQDFAIPPGKEQAEAFQPRYQQAREEYWARFPAP